MEKEIKITPPDGYEIDKENSTFECIKFKPIEKNFVTHLGFGDCRINNHWAFSVFEKEKEGDIVHGHLANLYLCNVWGKWCDEKGNEVIGSGYFYFIPNENKIMELVRDMKRKKCHDCGVQPGEPHKPGCDTERCPKCGCQLISCDCFINDQDEFDEIEFNKYEPDIWSGIMFENELQYAEDHDLFVDINTMKPCDRDDPNAWHDINTAVSKMLYKPNLKK